MEASQEITPGIAGLSRSTEAHVNTLPLDQFTRDQQAMLYWLWKAKGRSIRPVDLAGLCDMASNRACRVAKVRLQKQLARFGYRIDGCNGRKSLGYSMPPTLWESVGEQFAGMEHAGGENVIRDADAKLSHVDLRRKYFPHGG